MRVRLDINNFDCLVEMRLAEAYIHVEDLK